MCSNYLKSLVCSLTLIGVIIVGNVYGQSKEIPKELYIAAGIPDSLKEDANSVLRYSMQDVTVKSPGHSVMKIHTIVAILNEKDNHKARIDLPYNKKYSTVSSFEMIIYDATGKQLKKYHKSDMYEHAAEDDETLVSDERSMYISHTVVSYPTTVEMIFEVDNNSSINIDDWRIERPEQSVQNSYYRLSISNDAGFRFLARNTSVKPQKTNAEKTDTYTWHVSNLKAIKPEEGAMLWKVFPVIYFAANQFEFYGVPGDFKTWQNYGNWQRTLNADVCSLSPEREAEIRKMTDSIKTDKQKAAFLYKYMQQNMRYVSIQLGIGGLKPFPATFVDQKKYGDCKALSNYMSALLKAINIPSYYAMINAETDREPADPAFPYDPFNHVILCIPFKGDTTWLECTSNKKPFGKLGIATENRTALLVTETGGRLVNTPRSTIEDNQFNSEVYIALDADGGAKARVKILGTGEYRAEYFGVESLKADEQKEFFQRVLNMKQPTVFEIKPSTDKDGVKELNLELEYDKFCDVAAGDKQFYRPKVFDLWGFTVPVLEKRKSDYYFDNPMQKSCTTTIDLPTGFEVETLPTNQSLKFTYGSYEISYVYNAAKNQVISKANFKLTNHVIPAAKYTEMQQYLDAIAKAQNKKLVIRHKA
jgi:transglutaminase-like putative cysteine protease